MRHVAFVVPGSIEARTGGSIYDRRIAEGLRARGWRVSVHELPGAFPHPDAAARTHAAAVFGGLEDGSLVLADGLAFGTLPALVAREASRLRLVALVHLPLAEEVGLDPGVAAALAADERRALAFAAAVVVTGATTVPLVEALGVARVRIALVEPGTDRAPVAVGSEGGTLALLSVASVTPGKGHDLLIEALAEVPTRAWHLTCAGSLVRHQAAVERLRNRITTCGLDDRVTLAGDVDAAVLAHWYARSDLFVLASYRETYGMAVAEAIARGLPVIATTTGAIPSIVGNRAGLLVPPGDRRGLTSALTRVLSDPALRAQLRDGALVARDRLPTWPDALDTMSAVLLRVAAHG